MGEVERSELSYDEANRKELVELRIKYARQEQQIKELKKKLEQYESGDIVKENEQLKDRLDSMIKQSNKGTKSNRNPYN